jgi:hypothetical protein
MRDLCTVHFKRVGARRRDAGAVVNKCFETSQGLRKECSGVRAPESSNQLVLVRNQKAGTGPDRIEINLFA